MPWIVLLTAIAVAYCIEKGLIPLASTPRLKVIYRWNYANAIMIGVGGLVPYMWIVQAIFVLAMGVWAIRFSNESLRIAEEEVRQHTLLRMREEAERKVREEEQLRKLEAQQKAEMHGWLAKHGCPRGFDCELMGADGEGGCENWKTCWKP